MARAAPLKVYRTAIGFHDAYVAAPSKKAALAAWGSDKDLFARGAAELVTDEALGAEALASPGKVIRRLRGTVAEQLAALPPDAPARARDDRPDDRDPKTATPAEARAKPKPKPKPTPKPKPKPRPSRAALDAAERAVAEVEDRHAAEDAELRRQEEALVRERRAAAARHAGEMRAAAAALEEAAAAFRGALGAWRDAAGSEEA